VTRKDGKMQWAKDGMPLYYWAKDMKKGDATGDGMNGVWDAAKP
jgi:predicted lipoprotein with Yx(FWY)xxD motif